MMPDTRSLSSLASPIDLRKQELSEYIADRLLRLFRQSVWFSAILTMMLAILDYAFIGFKLMSASDRLITEKVLMAIIGATIVQLGAVVAGIAYAVFKAPPSTEEVQDEDQAV